MTKKYSRLLLLLIFFFSIASMAQTPFGQIIQIYTRFSEVIGMPIWLLELREVETGTVSPYIYDIKKNDNFWLALSYGHTYQVITSQLTFGPYAVINNFCCLENDMIKGQSMSVTITGRLTPDPSSSKCIVSQYRDENFAIVNQN